MLPIKSFFTLSVIAVLALAIQSCTDSKGENQRIPKRAEPIPVKVLELKKSSIPHVIHASGQLSTDDETYLGFKTGGVVQSVFVKEGDAIKKGQLLAKLDLTEISAAVSQARFAFEKAERDYQRAKNLYQDSVATLEQLQNAETGLSVAREQLQAANFNRNLSEIHATANGYVLKKFVNPGQIVGPGEPVVLTNGAQSSNWKLKVGVSDKQWAAISIRNTATVSIDAFPGESFQASVTRKSEAADSQTGSFVVELTIDSDGRKLAKGMFGAADIQVGNTGSSWAVPYEAVLDADGSQGFVFVTSDENVARKQNVTIESFDGASVRISKGLEGAKALIVAGSAYLTDGSPIEIVD